MEALVLSRRDFREFDQIISLYTKDRGRIELLARGVKKITAKNSAHLEPFSYCLIELAEGRELGHLIRVNPVNFFTKIRQNFAKSLGAGFVTVLTQKLTEEGEADKRMFELLLSWLKFVDRALKFDSIMADAYVINLFSILGFNPILYNCVVCEKEYKELVKENLLNKKSLGIYFAGGGIICPTCRATKKYIGEQITDCGLLEVSNLQALLKGDWRMINEFDITDAERKKLHKLIYEFALFHSEKKIEDWRI